MAITTNKLTDNKIIQESATRTRRDLHTGNLIMTVRDFSDGPWDAPEPRRSHPHDQIIYLAEGTIHLFIDEESTRLDAGDTVAIPAEQPHTIQLLSPKVRLIETWAPPRK